MFAAFDSRYDFPLTWKPTDPIAAIHPTNKEQFVEWFKTMMTEYGLPRDSFLGSAKSGFGEAARYLALPFFELFGVELLQGKSGFNGFLQLLELGRGRLIQILD